MSYIDPFLQIKTIYNTLTASHKKMADFILENPEFVLQNSISDVAVTCKIAEATVSRFCKQLGYKGYHDFKISVARSLSDTPQSASSGDSFPPADKPILSTAQYLLSTNIQALNETSQLVSAVDLKRAVDILVAAKQIMFLGVGASLLSAMQGYHKFLRITSNVSINIESHMQFMAASLISPQDVAVVISHSGSTKEIVDLAKKVKERGAKVICITRYQKSPLTKYSDVTLLYSSDEQLLYGHSISASSTQAYLLDLLYIEFFNSGQEEHRKNQEDSSSILLDKLY